LLRWGSSHSRDHGKCHYNDLVAHRIPPGCGF